MTAASSSSAGLAVSTSPRRRLSGAWPARPTRCKQPHHVAGRMHQHGQIDAADIDAQFQARARHHCPQLARLERPFDLAAPVAARAE